MKRSDVMNINTVIIGAGYHGLKKAFQLYEQQNENLLLIEFEDRIDSEQNREIIDSDVLPFNIWFKSTVTSIKPGEEDKYVISVQTKDGVIQILAKHIVITTGAIEKPKRLNMSPGDRPDGEFTPSLALSLLERGYAPGINPLIILNNENAIRLAQKLESIPQLTVKALNSDNIEVVSVKGESRVTGITIRDTISDETSVIDCDSFVYSNGSIPNTGFAHDLGLALDENQFIQTNSKGETSMTGVLAFGACSTQRVPF